MDDKGGNNTQCWKDSLIDKWCWGTGELHVNKNEIRSFFNTIHKNKLKMDYRPKCEIRHYKTSKGNRRQNTDINRSNIFSDPSPRIMEIKANINKWDLHKLKSFCTVKETINKMK